MLSARWQTLPYVFRFLYAAFDKRTDFHYVLFTATILFFAKGYFPCTESYTGFPQILVLADIGNFFCNNIKGAHPSFTEIFSAITLEPVLTFAA